MRIKIENKVKDNIVMLNKINIVAASIAIVVTAIIRKIGVTNTTLQVLNVVNVAVTTLIVVWCIISITVLPKITWHDNPFKIKMSATGIITLILALVFVSEIGYTLDIEDSFTMSNEVMSIKAVKAEELDKFYTDVNHDNDRTYRLDEINCNTKEEYQENYSLM